MAHTAVWQFLVNETPKRARKAHCKVKSGCHTCKIRRKKCDEGKPVCNRCVEGGFKCDGYRPRRTKPAAKALGLRHASTSATPSQCASLPQHYPLILARLPPSEWFQTDIDYYCFDFFRHRTGPELGAYFDSSIWRSFILCASLLHPTVLQAVTAVGAAHRRYELGISPEAFRLCEIAAKLHLKTLRSLEDDQKNGNPFFIEINMLVSLLMSVFEAFQGNYDLSIAHYRSGITQLLQQDLKTIHRETQYKFADVNYKNIRSFTNRIEDMAPKVFGSPTIHLCNLAFRDPLDSVPDVFSSLEQARDFLITEGQYIWDTWRQLELGNLNDLSTQQFHVSRLLEWSKAYAEYCKSADPRSRPWRKLRLLKAYRGALYLVIVAQVALYEPDGKLIVPPCYPAQMCNSHEICRQYSSRRDALNTHFARALVTTEFIFHDRSDFAQNEHSIWMDSGIGPSLDLGAETCLSTKVRYQATSILPKGELKTKLLNTLGFYNLAEKLGSIEEHALAGALMESNVVAPKYIDMTCFMEEKKILRRYCSNDGFGGLLWTQEWITY